jgi:hypothetical protein
MKLQTIKLENGQEVVINYDSKAKCKSCGKEIFWSETKNGKAMPIELVSLARWNTHYATCPAADSFRKRKITKEMEEIQK